MVGAMSNPANFYRTCNHLTMLTTFTFRNNTHISRVGQAMASDEEHAYEIMKEVDRNVLTCFFDTLTCIHKSSLMWTMFWSFLEASSATHQMVIEFFTFSAKI